MTDLTGMLVMPGTVGATLKPVGPCGEAALTEQAESRPATGPLS